MVSFPFNLSAANAAGEDLLPYFNDVMDHLKIYLITNNETTPDFIKVCAYRVRKLSIGLVERNL